MTPFYLAAEGPHCLSQISSAGFLQLASGRLEGLPHVHGPGTNGTAPRPGSRHNLGDTMLERALKLYLRAVFIEAIDPTLTNRDLTELAREFHETVKEHNAQT